MWDKEETIWFRW